MTDYQWLRVNAEGALLTITLSSIERRNALSPAMGAELLDALGAFEADPDAAVLVLTGDGSDFCAGADLRGGLGQAPSGSPGDFADLLLRLAKLEKPSIAKVRGYALGAGLGLVAGCHFAVGAESSILGAPEIDRGLFPMMILAVLDRIMARRDLLRLTLLGQKLPAAEAQRLGILSEVVSEEALDAHVESLARKLAGQSPEAMARGLRALHEQAEMPLEEALPHLRDRLMELLATDDAREGLRAFAEKRPPRWKVRTDS